MYGVLLLARRKPYTIGPSCVLIPLGALRHRIVHVTLGVAIAWPPFGSTPGVWVHQLCAMRLLKDWLISNRSLNQ